MLINKNRDLVTIPRETSDFPIDLSNKTWFELEQFYRKFVDVGWYGQLQFVEEARANILFKEKRWKQCVLCNLERAFLACQGSGFSRNYKFDNVPHDICFTKKEWLEECDNEFCMFGNFGRAIKNSGMSDKDMIEIFLKERRTNLPYIYQPDEFVGSIKRCYRELKNDWKAVEKTRNSRK